MEGPREAEAAAIDEAAQSATKGAEDGDAGDGGKQPDVDPKSLPPASLATLMSMLSTQAMVALGVLPDPSTGQATPRPNLARHFIDLLGVLEEKTAGNRDENETKMFSTTLHELRMTYVELTRKS